METVRKFGWQRQEEHCGRHGAGRYERSRAGAGIFAIAAKSAFLLEAPRLQAILRAHCPGTRCVVPHAT